MEIESYGLDLLPLQIRLRVLGASIARDYF